MKYIFTLCLCMLSTYFLCANDTTKVTSHNKVVIKTNPNTGYTEYPSKVGFPDDSVQYRKVYMYLEFGCAPGLKCGEWDYINHIYFLKDSVRFELARFITPYGFYWNSSQNWKHGWYFDLTDFSYLLHDSFQVIYQHSGYEGNTDRGWTVTMDFFMVHGEAARIPKGIDILHRLSAPYGDVNNPFSNFVSPKNFTMPSGSDAVNFKVIQTGHGMDKQENCAEFCSKTRTVLLDNTPVYSDQVWRDNCGLNSLYPQAGTWIYDRAGWCPGAPVVPIDIYKEFNENSMHTFDLSMEEYSNTAGGSANYSLTTYAMYFDDKRKQFDAAIEDIVSPSTHYDYLRMNPTCSAPMINVRNMGKDTIRSVEFEYGKVGGSRQTIWVPCKIGPFQSQVLTLEAVYNWSGSNPYFSATITKVNEQVDQYPADNTMYSKITNSVVFPNKIIIVFKSNEAPTENYYTLKDAKGNVLRNKSTFQANTLYRDTVFLDNNLCYTFEFFDDGPAPSTNPLNKDGLDWWANTADGSGYIQIRNGNTNVMLKNFTADFGTKQQIQFTTTFNMNVSDDVYSSIQLEIMPNPVSQGKAVNMHVDVVNPEPYTVQIFDQLGKLLHTQSGNSPSDVWLWEGLHSGIYTAVLTQGNQTVTRKFVIL